MYSPDPVSIYVFPSSFLIPPKLIFPSTGFPASVILAGSSTGSTIVAFELTGILILTRIFPSFLSQPEATVPYGLSDVDYENSSFSVG